MTKQQRLRAVSERPRLTAQERQEMGAVWAAVSCRFCGWRHGGLCPRVKRIETSVAPNGARQERVWFWRSDEWEVPADAISETDVFGSVQIPPAEQPPIEATVVDTTPKKKAKA